MPGLFGSLSRVVNQRQTRPDRRTSADRYWLMGKDMTGGVWMNADEAIRLSAVWACVTVIAKAIAASEWDVFSIAPDGSRTPQQGTITWRLLNLRPNDEMIPFAFREALLILALVNGNAYAEIERDGMGRPVALWPLITDRCQLNRDSRGKLVLDVTNADGSHTELPYADVFHLSGPSIDGVAGFDTVKLAARSLGHAAAAERFGSAFYANGAAFGGVLKSDKNVGDDSIGALKDQIEQRHKGPDKAFRFLVLGGGLSYEKMGVDPDAAQFVQTRYLMIEEVCRWFGVPPHKIAHLLRSTFSNIEHQGLEFVRDALTPWCERLRQEADWKLIPGAGRTLRTRINIDWLSEGDAKSRADTDAALVGAGIMLRDEARAKRGWNSLGEDGKQPTVMAGVTSLKRALTAPPSAPIGHNGGPPLDPDEPDADDAPEGDDDDDTGDDPSSEPPDASLTPRPRRRTSKP